MHAIEINDLSKRYDNGTLAVDRVSMTVEEGDFFALLGPNGAGKSTIIGILTSLVRKTSGSVKIFGHDIDTAFAEAKSQLGVVPQEFNFNPFRTVQDILMCQAGYYGMSFRDARRQVAKYLDLLELSHKAKVASRSLSGGMKRRMMIARALLHEPKLLILDEPTAGVDIEIRRNMWDFLRDLNENGTTIILTTHYLEEAENLCRTIAIINHGHVIKNTALPELLRHLEAERFILYTKHAVEEVPVVAGYDIQRVDLQTLDVEVPASGSLGELVATLQSQGVPIQSMRNKANRLEELFLSITQQPTDNKHEDASS